MSKFISVTWSEGIDDRESEILVDTIDHTLRHLYMNHPAALIEPPIQVHVFGNWVIPALSPDQPYSGSQWYVEASYDTDLQRVIAPTFLELVRREPWQVADPHFDLALLDEDLTDFPAPVARFVPDHYSLGSSFPGTTAVMSVYRVRMLSDDYVRELALARLVRHHLGHVLAVPDFGRETNVERMGLETHCTNMCVMRNATTVEELASMAIEESEMGWPFCDQCTRDLNTLVVRHTFNWN
ncbi:MAG TPA: hypothetical protein GX702_07385 [Chloroflexi bacterium]|jgi:hypothetical protein|nr:hypothetical protein [Chloroflexota bacterium]